MAFVEWPSIGSFHQLRKQHRKSKRGPMRYRAKIKLHGTNSAVRVLPSAQGGLLLETQSRAGLITPEKDNCDFALYVRTHAALWLERLPVGVTVFGEWFGHRIQEGAAACYLVDRHFAVFALYYQSDNLGAVDNVVTDPEHIRRVLFPEGTKPIPNLHVLPWYDFNISVDWSTPVEDLQFLVEAINKQVAKIEKLDPWIYETFTLRGPGEGLVFYFEDSGPLQWYGELMFKAKGEVHKVVNAPAAAAEAQRVASVKAFAELVLTEGRLLQGAYEVYKGEPLYEPEWVGSFLTWVLADVKKETQEELDASGLTWEAVNSTLKAKARAWYLSHRKAVPHDG